MDALSIFFTVSSIVTIAIAAYGAIKMNRRNLLLGTFLFSLLPVMGESNQFHLTGDYGNLITATAFLCAAIISFPSKINYDSKNIAAVHLARKNWTFNYNSKHLTGVYCSSMENRCSCSIWVCTLSFSLNFCLYDYKIKKFRL